jgi:hypothetical protein
MWMPVGQKDGQTTKSQDKHQVQNQIEEDVMVSAQ